MRQYRADEFNIGIAVGWPEPSELSGSPLFFLASFGVEPELIQAALFLARKEGVFPDEALLAYGLMDETLFYQCLARHLRVPFADAPLFLDIGAAYAQAVEVGWAKIAHPKNVAFLSAPRGERLAVLLRMKAESGRVPAHLAITTPKRFARSVRFSASGRLTADASFALMSADENLSAKSGVSRRQRVVLIAAAAVMQAAFLTTSDAFL